LEDRLAEGSPEVTIQDRLRLQTLRAEVEARLSEAREAEATALAGIRAVVGDASADIDEEPLEAVEFDLAETPAGYVDSARAVLPQLRAARAAVTSVDALLEYERARFYPDLALFGGLTYARAQGVEEPPSAFANDPFNTLSAQVGLVLRWNLEPVSQAARVARVRAESKRAVAMSEAAELGAAMEVRRMHARALQARQRLTATLDGERAARGWVASVFQGEAVGVISARDLSDAYVAYFTLRSRVLQTTFDWNLATVELRRIAGEFAASTARP
ncbi:MAG TPA: TolC family protein, partial [Kofleriaceae bacterium]|nr:TolC family protein [Kofleriaceae bacterium]